jgi:hypothetical protein
VGPSKSAATKSVKAVTHPNSVAANFGKEHPELTLKATRNVFAKRVFTMSVLAKRVALSVSSRIP